MCQKLPATNPASHKLVANWVLGEFSAARNRDDIAIATAPVTAAQLGGLLRRLADGTLSSKMARNIFDGMSAGEAKGDAAADAIIERRGLRQHSDASAHEELILPVLAANPPVVSEVTAGSDTTSN